MFLEKSDYYFNHLNFYRCIWPNSFKRSAN